MGMFRADLYKIVREVAKTFRKKIGFFGRAFVKKAREAAQRQGLPDAKNVFWTLLEDKANWPAMTEDQKAGLQIATELMAREFETPDYTDYTPLPEGGKAKVDNALLELGKWAAGDMATAMGRIYIPIAKKNLGPLKKSFPDLSQPKLLLYLTSVLTERVAERPYHFLDGYVIYLIFNKLWA